MLPPFDEMLDDLINDHIERFGHDTALDEIISALELKLMALKEEQAADQE